jgi:hypothetical protein
MTSPQCSENFQEEFGSLSDKARLEVLLRKHFSGQALSADEGNSFKELGLKVFGASSKDSLPETNFTPTRKRGLERSTPSSLSSLSSENTTDTTVSKASAGLARVLHENRSMKEQFCNNKLKDIEQSLFKMDETFHAAASYNASFLFFMKYFYRLYLHLKFTTPPPTRKAIADKGEASEEDALAVRQIITDLKKPQTKKKGVEASRAYKTRRDWIAFLSDVSNPFFNPLMPNKSGLFTTTLCVLNFMYHSLICRCGWISN